MRRQAGDVNLDGFDRSRPALLDRPTVCDATGQSRDRDDSLPPYSRAGRIALMKTAPAARDRGYRSMGVVLGVRACQASSAFHRRTRRVACRKARVSRR